MILQLNPMMPVYIPSLDREGYAFAIESHGIENYLYFHVIMDGGGEIWSFDNTKVRGCINYTAGRSSVNKESKSEFIEKLK